MALRGYKRTDAPGIIVGERIRTVRPWRGHGDVDWKEPVVPLSHLRQIGTAVPTAATRFQPDVEHLLVTLQRQPISRSAPLTSPTYLRVDGSFAAPLVDFFETPDAAALAVGRALLTRNSLDVAVHGKNLRLRGIKLAQDVCWLRYENHIKLEHSVRLMPEVFTYNAFAATAVDQTTGLPKHRRKAADHFLLWLVRCGMLRIVEWRLPDDIVFEKAWPTLRPDPALDGNPHEAPDDYEED